MRKTKDPKRPARKRGRPSQSVPVPDSILVERNLSTLGFFNVSAPAVGKGQGIERTVMHRSVVEGVVVEGKVTYIGAASQGGLPTAADQDVYLAVLAFVTEVWQETGKIPQMVALSPSDLLRRMGKPTTGSYYEALERALLRIASTTIISENAIWVAREKRFQKDVVRVFDRVQVKGTVSEDGTVAARHQIWLSNWQVENLRASHYLLIDYPTYQVLRNDISRVLFPMLKLWLYASRREKRFEKRYDELCMILGIKARSAPSLIDQQLRPSLDELVSVGYLSKWEVLPVAAAVERAFKIVLHHHPNLTEQFERIDVLPPSLPSSDEDDTLEVDRHQFAEALVSFGVNERVARREVSNFDREALDRARRVLDFVRQKPKDGIANPQGYLVYMIRQELRSGPSTPFERPMSKPTAEEKRSLDDDINAQASEDLRRMHAFEAAIDNVIETLAPLELAGYHRRAEEQLLTDFPKAAQWTSDARAKQINFKVRRLVADDFEVTI